MQSQPQGPPRNPTQKSQVKGYLLLIFFGWLGAHRYYLGRWKTGLLYMVSLGFFGYGILFDLIFLYFMVKKRNQEGPRFQVDEEDRISFWSLFFSREKEELAPWAIEKIGFFKKIFDFFDNLIRIFMLLVGPLLILLAALYIDGSFLIGLIVLFVLVLVAYVGNMGKSLETFHKIFERYPQLAGIPFLSEVIDTVSGFYDYYFENKPKNVFYYMFYPLFLIFPSKKNKVERRLYRNLIILILITLVFENAITADDTYMSWSVIMGHIALIAIMIVILAVMPLVPIVTTSFKFRLSGKTIRLKIFATLALAMMIGIAYQELEDDKFGTTLFSELNIEHKLKQVEFEKPFTIQTEMFMSYYIDKIDFKEYNREPYIDSDLTEAYRRQITGMVTENEAKMFSVVLFPEPDELHIGWMAIHFAPRTFGQIKNPILLHVMGPHPRMIFRKNWEDLEDGFKKRLELIEDGESIDQESYKPCQVHREALIEDYNVEPSSEGL